MKLIKHEENKTSTHTYTFEDESGIKYIYKEFIKLGEFDVELRLLDRLLMTSDGAIVVPNNPRHSRIMCAIDSILNTLDSGPN